MKRIITLLAAAMLVGQAWAQPTFEVGNLKYTVIEGTTNVSFCSSGEKLPANLVIPSEVKNEGVTYTVTTIVDQAFDWCSELESVTIPSTITTIGNNIFKSCAYITEIIVDGGNTAFSSENGVLFNKDKTVLIYYPSNKTGAYTIPNTVTTIGDGAFKYCKNLTAVTIQNSVVSIGASAFEGCDKLTSVTIPNSVTSIGEAAFKSCYDLATVTLSNAITRISNELFSGCAFTSIEIPNGVTRIGSYAFLATDLTSLIIPNTVITIEERAFERSSDLETIFIPKSVDSIGVAAFIGNSKLTIYCEAEPQPGGWDDYWNWDDRPVEWEYDPNAKMWKVTVSANNAAYGSVSGGGTVKDSSSVTITATPADSYKFVKWSNGLTNATETITVTSDTTIVAEFAKEWWIATLLANNTEYGTVTQISGSNLDGSTYTAAALPKSGYKFVKWNNGLTTDTISITLTSDTTLRAEFAEIVYTGTCGDDARWSFSVPTKTLTISGTGSIDSYKSVSVFSTEVNRPWQEVADQIEKVVIGEGITNLGSHAFCYLNNLKEANISSTCDSYGGMSFADCPNLKKLVVAANSVYQANEYCFSNYDSCTVYVPADRVDYYKKDIIFGMFKNIVGGYLVTIDADIKCGTVEVESYIVPEGGKVTVTPKPNDGYIVTDVTFKDDRGYYAFTTYTNGYQYWIENNAGSNIIVKVEFSRKSESGFTYKVISSNNIAITGYQGTDSVITIPSKITDNGVEYTVTSIGDRAFDGNSDIKSVTIPNTVTNIGESAFSYPDLTSLTVPNSVKTIGEYAFSDVKNVVYNGSASGSPWGALTINGTVDGNYVFADAEKTHLTAYINPTNNMESSIDIPETVVSIGPNAILNVWAKQYGDAYYWGNEENPYLILWKVGSLTDDDNDITSFEVHEGCKYIYANAFALQYALESVTIPNSVISIGGGAFFNCDQLSTITIPDGVKVIGAGAFQNCGELVSVTVGKSVTNIDDYAFCNCQKLRTVNIPESVERIGDGAFCDCYNLSSLHIPKSVTEIGEKAFDNYYHDITIYSDATEWPAGWLFSESEVREVIFKTTPVAETAANAVNIYAHGNTIVVENATDEISVYDAMGRLVCRDAARHVSTVAESGIRAEIRANNPGLYIVKVGDVAKRVMVK